MYCSESEIAAPGGGVAADAVAPVVSCPCQGGEHQHSSPHASATYPADAAVRVSCMPRLLIVLSLLLLTAALPAAADAKVRKGPAGIAFYKPPKPLPGGKHGALIWARKLTGAAALKGGAATGCCSTARPASTARRSPCPGRRGPEGQGAEGRLAGHLLGARHDGHRRPVRALARRRRPARQLRLPAAQALAEGGLRGRAHRLRGARHAGRAPVPDRRARRAAACSTRCARRASSTSGSASASSIAGHSQGGQAALWAASLAPKYTPELKLRGTVAFAPGLAPRRAVRAARAALKRPSGLSGLAAMILRGIDIARPSLGVAGVPQRPRAALYPQTLTECLGRSRAELVRRPRAGRPVPPGRRPRPARRRAVHSSTTRRT